MDTKALVAAVRDAARRHNMTREALVPASFQAGASAYAEMAAAKQALRDQFCKTYGITIHELSSAAL